MPSINEQQKIIDIIERDEKLFLTHSKCVRIDCLEHCMNDMKSLIDIIEPVEQQENNILNQIQLIKNILVKKYSLNSNNEEPLYGIIEHLKSRYEKQSNYYATNAIGEFTIDESKIISIIDDKPSRADVSPDENSFIFSKLQGDNKVYFFSEKPNEVFSTGFFNVYTKYVDHFSSFLLSEHYSTQKNNFSTGTTMTGLGNETLSQIKIKSPNDDTAELTHTIYKLSKILSNLSKLKRELISLLIK